MAIRKLNTSSDCTLSSVPPAFSLSISDTNSEAFSCSSFLENNMSINFDKKYAREGLEQETIALIKTKVIKTKS